MDEEYVNPIALWFQGAMIRVLWYALALSLIGVGFFIGAWTSYLLDPRCSIPANTGREYIELRNKITGTDIEVPKPIP